MAESLAGLVERVTCHNPENGFAVLKVKVKGRQDLVTVVGTVTSVTAGEHQQRILEDAIRQVAEIPNTPSALKKMETRRCSGTDTSTSPILIR